MTWHDHLVMLLSFGAEIEHALMVQYLYAAYSISSDHLPEAQRAKVEAWRSSIIAVAKEEMGHLLTVQNVLTLLGAPVNLSRENFPYDKKYNPFPSSLRPFSKDTLSCYLFAEMPKHVGARARNPIFQRKRKFKGLGIDEKKIVKAVKANVKKQFPKIRAHRVGELYQEIIDLVSCGRRIPDSAFHEDTYLMQASFDDWGRGYRPEPYALDVEGSISDSPRKDGKPPPAKIGDLKPSDWGAHLLIERVATRSEVIKVLRELAGQGEAPHLRADGSETGEPSHYDRFLQVYAELEEIERQYKREHGGKAFTPAINVPTNPTAWRGAIEAEVGEVAGKGPRTAAQKGPDGVLIEAKCARHLAELFNQRYRMMLTYLEHSFRLARADNGAQPSLRAMVMHRVFGEMYNLKAIAGLLVRLPLRDSHVGGFAAPPFEMPYSLSLPQADRDIWRRHLDLLASAQRTCHALLGHTKLKHAAKEGETHPEIFDAAYDEIYRDIHERTAHGPKDAVAEQLKHCGGDAYLKTLVNLDNQTRKWMTKILGADVKDPRKHEVRERAAH